MIIIGIIVVLILVGLLILAHLFAYDQREKPIQKYIKGPADPPYYPDSLRRFLDHKDES